MTGEGRGGVRGALPVAPVVGLGDRGRHFVYDLGDRLQVLYRCFAVSQLIPIASLKSSLAPLDSGGRPTPCRTAPVSSERIRGTRTAAFGAVFEPGGDDEYEFGR